MKTFSNHYEFANFLRDNPDFCKGNEDFNIIRDLRLEIEHSDCVKCRKEKSRSIKFIYVKLEEKIRETEIKEFRELFNDSVEFLNNEQKFFEIK